MKTKTKLTVAILSAISLVGLAGTGYAGWVIAQNASGGKDGKMIAYDIQDNGVDLTVNDFDGKDDDDDDDTKGKIIWGKTTKDSSLSNNWFGFTTDTKDEEFNPILNFTVRNKVKGDKTTPVVTATIEVTDNNNAYKTCLDAKLIKGPAVNGDGKYLADISAGVTLQPDTADPSADTFNYKLNIWSAENTHVFGWGDYFNGENPVNFYNQYDAKGKIGETDTIYFNDANDKRKKIHGLNGLAFKITITASRGTK